MIEILLHVDRAAGAAQAAGEREALHLLAEGIDPERLRSILVLADGGKARAEPGARQPPGDEHGEQAERQREVVEPDRIPELEVGGAVVRPHQNAEPTPGDRQRIGDDAPDLGDGERDEREVGALEAGAVAQHADQPPSEGAGERSERPGDPGVHAIGRLQDGRNVGADAEEHDMAERGLAGKAAGDVPGLAEIGGKQNEEADVDRVVRSEYPRVGDESEHPEDASIGPCRVTARLRTSRSGAAAGSG